MSTTAPGNSPRRTPGEELIRYVTELEGPDDYWLSITDAARVCRVQDVSIRRAISAGRLPVRRQPAGENKRTRFVRASDLPRANFPILDSGAAITSDIRKVDVLNIPLQQQRLAEQARQLETQQETQAAELARLHEQMGVAIEHFAAIQQTQAELAQEIEQRAGNLSIAIEQAKQDAARDVATLTTRQEQIQRDLEVVGQRQQETADRLEALFAVFEEHRHVLTRQSNEIGELQDQVQRIQQEAQAGLKQAQEDMHVQLQESEKHLLAQFQTAIELQRTQMLATIEQQARDLYGAIQQTEQDEARDVADLTKRQDQLKVQIDATATRAAAAMSTALGEQRRTDAVEERLEQLTARIGSAATVAQDAQTTVQGQQGRLSEAERQLTTLTQQIQAERSARVDLEARLAWYEAVESPAESPRKQSGGKRKQAEPPV